MLVSKQASPSARTQPRKQVCGDLSWRQSAPRSPGVAPVRSNSTLLCAAARGRAEHGQADRTRLLARKHPLRSQKGQSWKWSFF